MAILPWSVLPGRRCGEWRIADSGQGSMRFWSRCPQVVVLPSSRTHSPSCTMYNLPTVHYNAHVWSVCSALCSGDWHRHYLGSNRFTARAPVPHCHTHSSSSWPSHAPPTPMQLKCALSRDNSLKYIWWKPHLSFWLNDAAHTCFVAQMQLQTNHRFANVWLIMQNLVLRSSFHINHLRGNCILRYLRYECRWRVPPWFIVNDAAHTGFVVQAKLQLQKHTVTFQCAISPWNAEE